MTEKTATEEKFEFQAEVGQLLNIITHSVYSEKEVFLRELISNASDACNKLQYQEATNKEIQSKGTPLEIRISVDKEKKTITVEDSGIGMTRDELIANIGAIAHSGSKEFFTKLSEAAKKDVELIGQFGIGFYSAFIVAKSVSIKTRSYIPGAKACEWRSDGLGSYTVGEIEKENRGTTIELQLRDDLTEYTDEERLIDIVKKHSNFVSYPVYVGEKIANEVKAIWTQPRDQISDEEYDSFYQFISNRSEKPLSRLHVSADAPIQFTSILFFPQNTFEMLGMPEEEHGLSLYTRKILIQSHCKDLLPKYLRFVWGMLDSEDIPLNISRETLQENRLISKIRSIITKKILDHLIKIAKDDEAKYIEIWKAFGKIIREGVTLDFTNREKIAKLLRFNSSSCEGDSLTSLDAYIERMQDDQKEIYYAGGANKQAITNSPHIEVFNKKKIEVIYLLDPVDEFVLSALGTFSEKPIKSIDMDDIEITKDPIIKPDTEDKDESLAFKSAFDGLLKKAKDVLGDKVTDVKESKRLTESPCCVLNPDTMASSHMQKIMQMSNKDYSIPKVLMEINRNNQLIKNLTNLYQKDPGEEILDECINQLYENCIMPENLTGTESHKTVPRIYMFMNRTLEAILDKKK